MRVAIVGAGVCGLVAIKCCVDEALEPVCFERTGALGGIWNYRAELSVNKDEGQAALMYNTVTNASKEMMALSDFPPPAHFPTFMPHQYVHEYLRLYSNQFGLDKYIRTNSSVTSVKRSLDFEDTGRWLVTVQDTITKQETSDTFDAVMVCTGREAWPQHVTFEGQHQFKGVIMHSQQYRHVQPFTDKAVVVVGFAYSACDTATDLADVCKQVYLSRASNNWLSSRLTRGGRPLDADLFVRWKMWLPARVLDFIYERRLNERIDHDLYNITPSHRFTGKRTVITEDLPFKLQCGKVLLKPNIRRFAGPTSVEFDDGSVVNDVDAVVMATGYDVRLPFMEPGIVSDADGFIEDLYLFTFAPRLKHQSLAVTGHVDPDLSVWPIAELQARAATQVFKGLIKLLPADVMASAVTNYRRYVSNASCKSRKRTWLVTSSYYMLETLSTLVGCRPNLWLTLLTDPVLWWHLLTGPMTSYQMRLSGRGRWPAARQAIMGQCVRLDQPLTGTHRLEQTGCVGVCGVSWTVACVLVLVVGMCVGVCSVSWAVACVLVLVGGMLVTVLCNACLAY